MEYVWLKALHVASVLIFTGGVFVQAFGVAAGKRAQATTVDLVSRWDQRVTMPAMLVAWFSGAAVAMSGNWFSNPWLWVKLVVVVGLSAIHGVQAGRLRRLRQGEVPEGVESPFLVPITIAVVLAVIAVLAVTKPF